MFEISSIYRIVQRERIDPPLLSYQDSEIYRGYKFKREFRAITLHFCCEIEINRPDILFSFVFFFLSLFRSFSRTVRDKRGVKKKRKNKHDLCVRQSAQIAQSSRLERIDREGHSRSIEEEKNSKFLPRYISSTLTIDTRRTRLPVDESI